MVSKNRYKDREREEVGERDCIPQSSSSSSSSFSSFFSFSREIEIKRKN